MKNKPFLTLLTIALLCGMISYRTTKAKAEPKPQGATVGCLIVTVIVGGIVVYSFYKICDRALPSAPPKTNSPPSTNTPTRLSGEEYGPAISNYWSGITAEIQCASNLITWETAGRMRLTIQGGAAEIITEAPDGTPLVTNRVAIGTVDYAGETFWSITNDASAVIRSHGEPIKLWRVK